MKNAQLHIYYDPEADYLEIRFGEPTPSVYEKTGPDTFMRVDEKTGDIKGYAIYNVKKSTSLRTLNLDIPENLIESK